jgi:hypothetical protein
MSGIYVKLIQFRIPLPLSYISSGEFMTNHFSLSYLIQHELRILNMNCSFHRIFLLKQLMILILTNISPRASCPLADIYWLLELIQHVIRILTCVILNIYIIYRYVVYIDQQKYIDLGLRPLSIYFCLVDITTSEVK